MSSASARPVEAGSSGQLAAAETTVADFEAEEPFGPTEADLAEMFGGGSPIKEEDQLLEEGGELPELEAIRQRVPLKTQVLMEELFRAKLAKVQRVNPKKIR